MHPVTDIPVLNIGIVESRPNVGAAVITKSAFTNTQQINELHAIIESNLPGKTNAPDIQKEVSVIVSPNPFYDKLTYNYFLSEQLSVSIELYDLSGEIQWLACQRSDTTSGSAYRGIRRNEVWSDPGRVFYPVRI